MKYTSIICVVLATLLTFGINAENKYQKMVNEDAKAFRDFYAKKFPKVKNVKDYKDGVYAIDSKSREQWLEIEEFPPYELTIDDGKVLFETPFANGKTYASCFVNGGINIRHHYPRFDTKSNQVITLELAINQCRKTNGEKLLGYKKGEIAAISSYMASTSRGQEFNLNVPNEQAYQAYLDGKKFFYSKRGQLNLSCSDCHLVITGNRLRADIPGPAIGQTTGFPVYRSSWGGIGTLHRRYAGCNKNIRAMPFKAQSNEYRNLEYFQSLMSQGLEINGPSARK